MYICNKGKKKVFYVIDVTDRSFAREYCDIYNLVKVLKETPIDKPITLTKKAKDILENLDIWLQRMEVEVSPCED